jgi:hypothetical protein
MAELGAEPEELLIPTSEPVEHRGDRARGQRAVLSQPAGGDRAEPGDDVEADHVEPPPEGSLLDPAP